MALIESHYTINVAEDSGRKNFEGGIAYLHYCRIELGNINQELALAKAKDIASRFPAPQFSVSLMYVRVGGTTVTI